MLTTYLKYQFLFDFLNSFLSCGDFCHRMINFANSLDPDPDQQNIGPDLDSGHTDSVRERIFLNTGRLILKKSADGNKSMENYPVCKE